MLRPGGHQSSTTSRIADRSEHDERVQPHRRAPIHYTAPDRPGGRPRGRQHPHPADALVSGLVLRNRSAGIVLPVLGIREAESVLGAMVTAWRGRLMSNRARTQCCPASWLSTGIERGRHRHRPRCAYAPAPPILYPMLRSHTTSSLRFFLPRANVVIYVLSNID